MKFVIFDRERMQRETERFSSYHEMSVFYSYNVLISKQELKLFVNVWLN